MSDRQGLRQVYIERLIELAANDDRIVSLDTDSQEATMADKFAAEYPQRAFSFGIAEQDMVTAAGGMATMGLVPFVNSYSMFIAMRALDQVRNSVAYPNLNVNFVLSHHGLDAGADGVTHQLTEDIAIFRTVPNLIMLSPADAVEMRQMVDFAVSHEGPVVIKSGKTKQLDVHDKNYVWKLGVPSVLAAGDQVAIVATGIMIEHAIGARSKLAALRVSARIVNLSTLNGVDHQAVLDSLEGCKLVITMEDHSIQGGLGGIVAEILCEHRPTKLIRLGLRDTFAECGSPVDLYRRYEMDAEAVVVRVKRLLDDVPNFLSN